MTESEECRWKGHYLYGDNYFDPKNDPPLLVIYVTEPLKEGSGLSAHTTYLITTTVFATKKSYCTRRRYNEFKKLFEEMTKIRGVNLSSFPKKKLKKFVDDVVEERRLSFEIILREMADHHQIVISPLFRRFIEVPLNVNVFPSDFNINSYTARRKSTFTARDQPKHQSISKKAPPPPPPSSSQSSVNLTSDQMVTLQIDHTQVEQQVPPDRSVSPQPSTTTVSPVSPLDHHQPTQEQQEQPVSPTAQNSTSTLTEEYSPRTPVIILQPTQQFQEQTTTTVIQQAPPPAQQQPVIDVSTFIEEMRQQQQSRLSINKSPITSPTSPTKQTSEPVQEFDDEVVEVRQAPVPPPRRSSALQYENSNEEETSDYSSNFRPMIVVEDEALDQPEEDNNFNMAMLNLGAQPIKVQPRLSTGVIHTPYHQIKRDSITSKLADMNPEERVQEILRQIKGETNEA